MNDAVREYSAFKIVRLGVGILWNEVGLFASDDETKQYSYSFWLLGLHTFLTAYYSRIKSFDMCRFFWVRAMLDVINVDPKIKKNIRKL